jgi:hypothetical protein
LLTSSSTPTTPTAEICRSNVFNKKRLPFGRRFFV